MTEFYLICALFVTIVLATSSCSRLQSLERDNRSIEMEVIMTDEECRGRVVTSNSQDVSDDKQEIKGPR